MDTTALPGALHRQRGDATPVTAPHAPRLRPLVAGHPDDPRWARPALLALLVATAAFYLWGLSINGWANSFYSAAAQAGSESWKAFFYGSSDAANSITVDKPPASLWIMALSVRAFGLSSWSILVPEALMGVASVGVVYATVRRHFGAGAGLLAGAVLATTPVAVLMFRFNNPDALLVLLLTIAAYATVRAVENGSTRWLVLVGTLVGFGFLTKMLQALLIVPGVALAFLIAAPTSLGRRIRSLLLGGLAMIVSAGWWIAIVELVPAKDRPYIGGSQTNSILELTLGYNGLGRITGNEVGSVTAGGTTGTGGQWGTPSLLRMFSSDIAGNIAWLLPAALVALVAGLVLLRRRPRIDGQRAALVVWGGWLLVTGLCFSLMAGIFHQYYTIALAPAIAALTGMGASLLWARRRTSMAAVITLSATVMGSAIYAYALLIRSTGVYTVIGYAVLVIGGAVALVLPFTRWLGRHVSGAVATLGILAVLAGPLGYSVDTVATAKTGSIVSAGPVGGMGGGGMPGGGTRGGGGGTPPAGTGAQQGGLPTAPGGTGTGTQQGAGGSIGSLLNGSTSPAAVTALLETDASSYTWVAAAIGSQSASGYQLASEQPVMAIGGFNGSDPSPTLAQFQAYVAAGQIHYFIGSGTGGGSGGGTDGSSSAISAWVAATFAATTVDGVTLYDLTAGA
jgi:4-amino-4-deoxy-L-arabinose transferase-like glycosyltransferase